MSIEHCLSKVIIFLDETNSLLIKTKTEDVYVWEEVYLISNGDQIYIGAHSKDHIGEHEWIIHNNNYVAFLRSEFGYGEDYVDYRDDDFGYLGKRIVSLFDIQKQQFVLDANEVLSIYNKEFRKEGDTEKVFYTEDYNREKIPTRIRIPKQ